MNSFKIKATGKYVPKKIVYNKILEEENNLEKGYIQKNWYRKKILFEWRNIGRLSCKCYQGYASKI